MLRNPLPFLELIDRYLSGQITHDAFSCEYVSLWIEDRDRIRAAIGQERHKEARRIADEFTRGAISAEEFERAYFRALDYGLFDHDLAQAIDPLHTTAFHYTDNEEYRRNDPQFFCVDEARLRAHAEEVRDTLKQIIEKMKTAP